MDFGPLNNGCSSSLLFSVSLTYPSLETNYSYIRLFYVTPQLTDTPFIIFSVIFILFFILDSIQCYVNSPFPPAVCKLLFSSSVFFISDVIVFIFWWFSWSFQKLFFMYIYILICPWALLSPQLKTPEAPSVDLWDSLSATFSSICPANPSSSSLPEMSALSSQLRVFCPFAAAWKLSQDSKFV